MILDPFSHVHEKSYQTLSLTAASGLSCDRSRLEIKSIIKSSVIQTQISRTLEGFFDADMEKQCVGWKSFSQIVQP